MEFFHSSRTCHTLKDLENALPTAAKIHKMSVKELVKELTDENQVRVEKIGSNNWYWAWLGEEKAEKRRMISQLEGQLAKIQEGNQELRTHIAQCQEQHKSWGADVSHLERLMQRNPLRAEVEQLASEKDAFLDSASGSVEDLLAEVEKFRTETTNLTDAIHILDDFLVFIVGGDKQTLEEIRNYSYGPCWADGEGLVDIDET